MLQHMQSRSAQSIGRHPLDLHGYNAMIHLGYVGSLERFALAIQALNKIRRVWPETIRLIVAIEDRKTSPWLQESPHCTLTTPGELQTVLHDYRKSGSLLVPDQNESAGDATLHALASGVPPGALNLHVRRSGPQEARPRHGEALLAVGRACHRSN